jgi:DNA-binding transcriptional regulator YdaS (Cro superfamily)
MKLSTWISAEGGREAVARKLGVTPSAIHYWLKKGNLPRPRVIVQIGKLSGGQVTVGDIWDEVLAPKKSRKNRGRK